MEAMTEMQKKMQAACGHEVEIRLAGGFKPVPGKYTKPLESVIGKCISYTKPLDNDPEVAGIDIKVPGFSSIYEITEDEIETLTIKASK